MNPFPPYVRPDRTVLDTIADLALLGAGLGTVVFVLAYLILFRWRENSAGRSVLYFIGSLVLVLGLTIVTRMAGGDYWGRAPLRLIVYGATFLAAWRLVLLLGDSWRRGDPALELQARESTRRTPTKETPVTASNIIGEPVDGQPPFELDAEVWQPTDERILNTVEVADLGDGTKVVANNLGVATQVANPVRATVRTLVAVAVGLVLALPTVNAVLLAIAAELAASGLALPAWVTATINGAILAVAVASGIVTRVLAIPGVNAWLGSHALTRGLTAVPLQKATTLDVIA